MNNIVAYFLVFLKGLAMGAADVVPGVSGGTIAFITGIYEKLLDSISAVNFGLFKILKKDGIKATWNSFNGTFLVSLFLGIGVSLFSLAKGIEWLLEFEPIKLWAFFFGLVLASIIYVGKQIEKWGIGPIIGLALGAVAAFSITLLPPLASSSEWWYMFLCGMLAVCAMILPGISGSFILLILGAYQPIIEALADRNFSLLAVVAAGCAVGLLTFARILKWLFKKFKNVTIAILTGFLVGSLNKIWPWKEVEQVFVKHAGEPDQNVISLVEHSVLPSQDYRVFAPNGFDNAGNVTDWIPKDPEIIIATGIMIGGFALIFIMEFVAKKMNSKQSDHRPNGGNKDVG
ncbi:MAG: putative membrane protein [Parvicellaceae bacterium]|jgi:putative membrane protein